MDIFTNLILQFLLLGHELTNARLEKGLKLL